MARSELFRNDANAVGKYLTKETLIEILGDLPDGFFLIPNKVMNLAVSRPDGSYYGYIDFAEGCFEKDES